MILTNNIYDEQHDEWIELTWTTFTKLLFKILLFTLSLPLLLYQEYFLVLLHNFHSNLERYKTKPTDFGMCRPLSLKLLCTNLYTLCCLVTDFKPGSNQIFLSYYAFFLVSWSSFNKVVRQHKKSLFVSCVWKTNVTPISEVNRGNPIDPVLSSLSQLW